MDSWLDTAWEIVSVMAVVILLLLIAENFLTPDVDAQIIAPGVDPNPPIAISPAPGLSERAMLEQIREKILILGTDRQGRVICSPRSRVRLLNRRR